MKNDNLPTPDANKMRILKMMVLSQMLPEKEVEKLYGCDFEFTIQDDMIVLLEVWNNPRGKHNYKNKYRQEFKMKDIPLSVICED